MLKNKDLYNIIRHVLLNLFIFLQKKTCQTNTPIECYSLKMKREMVLDRESGPIVVHVKD